MALLGYPRKPYQGMLMIQPKYNQNDWKVETKKTLIQEFLCLFEYTLKIKLFSGQWSQPLRRIMAQSPEAVVVIPFDPIKQEIVMIEQFRIGATRFDDQSPWLLEFVAGMVDDHEDVEQAAKRELKEETGLECQSLIPIYRYFSSPGLHNEWIHLYCAIVDSGKKKPLCGVSDEGEDIQTHRLSIHDAVSMCEQGKFNNGAAIIGVQWIQLHQAHISSIAHKK